MENNRHWIAYDWFKLLVALVLLVIWIILMLRPPQLAPTAGTNLPAYPPASFTWTYDAANHALLDPQGVRQFTLSADGKMWQPVIPAEAQTASSQPAPSGTPLPTTAPTQAPTTITAATLATTATPTKISTSAPLATPAATETTTPAATAGATEAPTLATTATAAATSAANCQAPAPARLVVGKTAKVLSNLNLRSEPKIDNNILVVNPAGAILKVLQGPVCVPYQNSAYLWWQVESPNGKTGWSAENYLNGRGYYILPVP
jgi:hypothetical protein